LGFFAYVIWSGGDHMAAARVLLPAIGPLSLLAIAAIGSLPVALGRNVGLLCLLLLVVAAFNARSFRMDWAAFNGTIVGQHIQTAWPAGSVVALNTAGSTPFFGRGHVYIDMLGLNDRVIAKRDDVPFLAQRQKTPGHGKGDAAYVLSRQPDYIILGGAEGIDVADAEKWFLTGVELKALPEFAECYQNRLHHSRFHLSLRPIDPMRRRLCLRITSAFAPKTRRPDIRTGFAKLPKPPYARQGRMPCARTLKQPTSSSGNGSVLI
jgi:hypothetical protein